MVSVIVPVYNEEDQIGEQIDLILKQASLLELIIVDGGSTDNTVSIIENVNDSKLKLITSKKGRAAQMNVGAGVAKGEILFFLHADTRLPTDGLELILRALKKDKVIAGSFYIEFDFRHPLLNLYSKFSKINQTLFTYGDQGLFVKRTGFTSIGGFKDIPIMEDLEIQKRLRAAGKFTKLGAPVITSARRYLAKGILWNQIKNTGLVFLYLMGASPSKLTKMYPKV